MKALKIILRVYTCFCVGVMTGFIILLILGNATLKI